MKKKNYFNNIKRLFKVIGESIKLFKKKYLKKVLKL